MAILKRESFSFTLLAKHRSARDSLASKVKDIMYVIFKEFNLPTIPAINIALKESEIHKWKGCPTVKICYGNLFKKIKNLDLKTYMLRILQILKGKNQLSNIQIAYYAISICEILLNLKNLHIQVTESIIKSILTKNLKKITSKDNYSYSNNDEIEASQEAEEIHKGVDKAEEVVDEVEEVADEAEEVLQEEEENEIREKEDEEKGGRIYINKYFDHNASEQLRYHNSTEYFDRNTLEHLRSYIITEYFDRNTSEQLRYHNSTEYFDRNASEHF
ncbi:unnamed protein product [Rhizophagus irregularis]|nr:unnamed protein product [Rhizophagus irregularis]